MSAAASDSPNKKKPVVQWTETSCEQPVFYEFIAGGRQKPSRRSQRIDRNRPD